MPYASCSCHIFHVGALSQSNEPPSYQGTALKTEQMTRMGTDRSSNLKGVKLGQHAMFLLPGDLKKWSKIWGNLGFQARLELPAGVVSS